MMCKVDCRFNTLNTRVANGRWWKEGEMGDAPRRSTVLTIRLVDLGSNRAYNSPEICRYFLTSFSKKDLTLSLATTGTLSLICSIPKS